MSRASTIGVPPRLERAAAIAWRLVAVAVALSLVLWLLGRLRLALFPVVVALFLTRVLIGPVEALTARGWRRSLASALVLLAFLAVVLGALGAIVAAVSVEVGELGPTLRAGVDDVERWLVEDSPVAFDALRVAEWRADLEDATREALRTSRDRVVSGAVLVVELILGGILAVFLTFFALRDGPRFTGAVRSSLPAARRDLADRMARRAWASLAGYLRGAAILGLVEGAIIALTMVLVGAELAVVVAVLTFGAAFVPFVGAIVAGSVAVLVALATGGVGAAAVVLGAVVVVQQLDNDVLAPVIYGRALRLHPAAVLLSVVVGGALFGLAGSALAVPVLAVGANVFVEWRHDGATAPDAPIGRPPTPER